MLSRRIARCIAPRMATDCSFFRLSMAFTVCALFCSANCSGLLNLPLDDVYYPGPVRVLYCTADGSGLLILPLVKGFHDGLRAVLLRRWQRIAHSSARQRLSRRIADCIAQRMSADCSYFRSSKAFTTDCTLYCSADGSGLLIVPLFKGFHDGLRAVFHSGGQRIAHTSARQRLSQRFARRIAQRMAAHCSFFRSSTALPTVRARYCSAVVSALLIPPLINGFSASYGADLLSGWQQVAHTPARQRL